MTGTALKTGTIEQAYIVPGLPHLAFETPNADPGWQRLREAMQDAGQSVLACNPDVLVLYSTQWVSVLGHSFQFAAHPQGVHVDENWHELGDFPFSFAVDRDLTAAAAALAESKGLATRLVDYEGFPIDTGTLVALQAFNPDNRIPVMIVSSNIYAGKDDSMTLGKAVGEAIRQSGKRAVVVNCSLLSGRFLTDDVKAGTDRVSRAEDDDWNRRMLALLEKGDHDEALRLGPDFAAQANADMGFKGFYWLMGVLGMPASPAQVLAYGPLWGTGAAVVQYKLQ